MQFKAAIEEQRKLKVSLVFVYTIPHALWSALSLIVLQV